MQGFTLNNPKLFSRSRKDALAIADVLADTVLTDAGVELGTVRDVIVDLAASPPDVVGYEIEPGPALPSHGHRVLVPIPATLSVSGERLMPPAEVTEFVVDDLAAFGAAVNSFRKGNPA